MCWDSIWILIQFKDLVAYFKAVTLCRLRRVAFAGTPQWCLHCYTRLLRIDLPKHPQSHLTFHKFCCKLAPRDHGKSITMAWSLRANGSGSSHSWHRALCAQADGRRYRLDDGQAWYRCRADLRQPLRHFTFIIVPGFASLGCHRGATSLPFCASHNIYIP